MADQNGSSNTAIVAIVLIVIIALGLLYFLGVFNPKTRDHDTNILIEQPVEKNSRPIFEKPTKR